MSRVPGCRRRQAAASRRVSVLRSSSRTVVDRGGRWAAGRWRWIGAGGSASRKTGCAGTGCGRTAGRVRSADGAEHDCSGGVPRTWLPGSASRASRVGAASVSGSPPDRVHRTSARSGQGASGGRASPREWSAGVRAGRCRGTAGARGERVRSGPSEPGAAHRGESTVSAPRCHCSRAGEQRAAAPTIVVADRPRWWTAS